MITERTNWKRERITSGFVKLAMTSGDMQTKGHVLGCIGIHQDADYKRGGWTITHLPTGLAVPRTVGSKHKAFRAARFWARVLENVTTQDQVFESPRCTRAWKAWINWVRRNS